MTEQPNYLDIKTLHKWITEYNEEVPLFNRFHWLSTTDPEHYLFETTVDEDLSFVETTAQEVFADVWRKSNHGTYYDDRSKKVPDNLKELFENKYDVRIAEATYESEHYAINDLIYEIFEQGRSLMMWQRIYDKHAAEIEDDPTEFLDNIREFTIDNNLIYVDTSNFYDYDEVLIPVFIALANRDHFNVEAGDDGFDTLSYDVENLGTFKEIKGNIYDVDRYETVKEQSPTATFIEKIGKNATDATYKNITYRNLLNYAADVDDEFTKTELIEDIYEALSNASNNVTLGLMATVPIKLLLDNNGFARKPLTVPKGSIVTYHGYIFGNGAATIADFPLPETITYDANEWTLVPEETWGYSLTSVYGIDIRDFDEANDFRKLLNS